MAGAVGCGGPLPWGRAGGHSQRQARASKGLEKGGYQLSGAASWMSKRGWVASVAAAGGAGGEASMLRDCLPPAACVNSVGGSGHLTCAHQANCQAAAINKPGDGDSRETIAALIICSHRLQYQLHLALSVNTLKTSHSLTNHRAALLPPCRSCSNCHPARSCGLFRPTGLRRLSLHVLPCAAHLLITLMLLAGEAEHSVGEQPASQHAGGCSGKHRSRPQPAI